MSTILPTLDALYDDFLGTFGNFTQYSEDALTDHPNYTEQKTDMLRRYFHSLSHPNSADPYFFAELLRSYELETATKGMSTNSDPLLAALQVRCAEQALKTPELSQSWRDMFHSEIKGHTSSASLCGIEMHTKFLLTFGENTDVNLSFFLLQIRAYLQYWEFRAVRDNIYEKSGADRTNIWTEFKLGEFWDYSKVHPFLRALCPPGEIWDKYILNGKVCSLNAEGCVVESALDDEEMKKHPPKLLWNIISSANESDSLR